MPEETINFQIPMDKIDEFIILRLVEIEARMMFLNQQQILMYAELKKNDPDFNLEEYLKSTEDILRKVRLELNAAFIKQYS
jgi:hypothetical protein